MRYSPNVIQTYTRRLVDPAELSVYDIDWRDVAHALARVNRYAGHTKHAISVAEHCCRVHDWLLMKQHHVRTRLMGLWHDAGEAYVVDIPAPLKRSLPKYKHIAEKAQSVCDNYLWNVMKKHVAEFPHSVDFKAIEYVDKKSCLYEALAGWPGEDLHPIWYDKFGDVVTEDLGVLTPQFWSPERAEAEFRGRLMQYIDEPADGAGRCVI